MCYTTEYHLEQGLIYKNVYTVPSSKGGGGGGRRVKLQEPGTLEGPSKRFSLI